jgi:hypothetical protein
MRRLLLLLVLLPGVAGAQSPALAGRVEGETYYSATGEFSVPLPVLRELGGTWVDTEHVVTFSDDYNTHISIACFPQDSLQRWEDQTRGRRDYLLYFFTDFVLADFARRFPGSSIESARFLPELMEGAIITYALLPGGSHFAAKNRALGPPAAAPLTAKRGTLLFVRQRHVYVLSTELAASTDRTGTPAPAPDQENAQLATRLTELAGRLVFPPPRHRAAP